MYWQFSNMVCRGGNHRDSSAPAARRSEVLRDRFNRLRSSIKPSLVLGDEDHLAALLSERTAPVYPLTDWCEAIVGSERSSSEESLAETDDGNFAILQPTSGTTGSPKVAAIPYACLDANHRAIIEGLQLHPRDDTMLSWLPLSHDMGLIGFMATPLTIGASLVITDPSVFAAQPGNWMDWCAEYKVTVTGGPCFAYGIAASLMSTQKERMDLSSLRLAMNGAERVDIRYGHRVGCRRAGVTNSIQMRSSPSMDWQKQR